MKIIIVKQNIKTMRKIIALLTLFFLISCGSSYSIKRTIQTLEVSNDIDKAYQMAYSVANELNWNITNSDPQKHTFTAKTPQNISQSEESVDVFIRKSENGNIIVVKSSLSNEPYQKHIASYFESIKKQSLLQKKDRKIKLILSLPENM